jgi:rhomboid family GlyGly-CTERM serine protease
MSARARLRDWRVPLILTALLVAAQAAGWKPALEYRRSAILHGQLWRLLTGNIVHLGWVHLLRDVAGLLLIWGLMGRWLDERAWCALIAASALAVGLGLLAFNPAIAWYVGISGVLFALFCAGALSQLSARPLFAAGLLTGMATVLAWTLHAGALPGETAELGGAIVPQAHLYGAISGAAFHLTQRMRRRSRAGERMYMDRMRDHRPVRGWRLHDTPGDHPVYSGADDDRGDVRCRLDPPAIRCAMTRVKAR